MLLWMDDSLSAIRAIAKELIISEEKREYNK